MKTIFIISWKNVFRNRLRSSVVILSVALGVLSGVFLVALMNGMIERKVWSAINYEVSHIQLHHENFISNNEMKYAINESDEIINEIESIAGVKAVCKRTIVSAMANTSRAATGVLISGIDIEKEKKVTKLYDMIIDSAGGDYFSRNKKNSIVISKKLAEKLKVKVRSKIVLTFQTSKGEFTGSAFRVVGIYKTNNSIFDEMNVFVRNEDLVRLAEIPISQSHEIAVLLNDKKNTNIVLEKIINKNYKYKVRPWTVLQPELGMMTDWMSAMLYVFMIVILLALLFGIINTMLMVILERSKELGMLMAIGMNKKKVFNMIMFETIFLSLIGGVIGLIMSAIINWHYAKVGIDLSMFSEGFESIGYEAFVRPSIEIAYYFKVSLMVVITGILASIYPARKTLKMNPVEAIRTI